MPTLLPTPLAVIGEACPSQGAAPCRAHGAAAHGGLQEDGAVAKAMRITLVGIEDRSPGVGSAAAAASATDIEWCRSILSGLYASMQNPKVYPAGTICWLVQEPAELTVVDSEAAPVAQPATSKVIHVDNEEFGRVIFSKRMMTNHLPAPYEVALKQAEEQSS
ncbi:hypothetical protein CYMTET_30182 [Cymbomonas tetramitiformis]|uniref:Uncharacterized protein n=1 Tax=Cymbomonas tetramitiformis TaxID=36881 RepID=A0AAE0KU63_9CHLO|nr:hypothetical protein CYMTET_30182 [Cymbomonas tetramitiformis]